MRAEGRCPGDKGRAVIAHNRAIQAKQKRRDKIAWLSSITTGTKGADGLTSAQVEANRMILEEADQANREWAERCTREWQEKCDRLNR